MNLGNWLVEQIITEDTNIKRIVAIYPGRFQPFGQHHAKAFAWLQSQFGKQNAYVATSDKIDPPKSPFSCKEKTAIINIGSSAIVDEPVEEIINVGVGNGNSAQPDGTVTINADFNVIEIAVASHAASSGRVEQNSGVVTLKMLSLASTHPDPIEATYDLEAGKLETQNLKVGLMGPGMLSVKGTGEVVSVALKSEVGSQATLRFCGSAAGFPTMSFGTYTIEPGAALEVEGDKAVKPGKYTLILADEPLAGRFDVNLTGFAAGKAKLLENEPGIVLEVK
jgi:hypothetical protein